MLYEITDPNPLEIIPPTAPDINPADMLNAAQAYKEMETARIKAIDRMTGIVDRLAAIKKRLENISGDMSKVKPIFKLTAEFNADIPPVILEMELLQFTNYDLRSLLLPKVNAAIQSTLRRIRDEIEPDGGRPLL